MTVLSFGEVLFDVFPDGAFLGGAPLNFAAHAAKHGVHAVMLSAVGADTLGEDAQRQIAALGVDTACLAVCPDRPTGVCRVTLDANAVPQYALAEDTAWDAIPAVAADVNADVLYFGTLALRGEHNRRTLEALLSDGRFDEVFADVNLRAPFYTEETVRIALSRATTVKISDEELPALMRTLGMTPDGGAEDTVRQLAAVFPQARLWLLTCGDKGAYAWDAVHGCEARAAAVPTTVVSTVGAGDSFSAAFLSRYRQGASLEDSLRHASAVASFVVSSTEAVPAYDPERLS